MIITLSASELLLSTGVGARRHAANLLQNRPSEWSAPVDPLRARVEADPAVRRLVAVIDGQVEGVERSRITVPD